MTWTSWNKSPPPPGSKVAIVCNDGQSCSLALIVDGGEALEAEDAWPLSAHFLDGAIWIHLPDDYVIAFTDRDDEP